MSLESKIEMLTAAIDRLNANMLLVLNTPVEQPAQRTEQPTPSTTEQATAVETSPVATTGSFTQDDLRRLCMAKVKEDRAFKETLKDFLSRKYGVTKTSDVPDDRVQEAFTLIESGNLS